MPDPTPDRFAATAEALRQAALSADDAAGHFPAMYARVTVAVGEATRAGRFGDAGRMARFVEGFADWYLAPSRGDRPAPGCWRAAWDVGGDPGLLIVQHLLLGINAHVNHDLPQVVVALADVDGDLSGLRGDFEAINAILAEMVPVVLRDLGRVSAWVNLAAGAGGGRLFDFSLDAARDQAWRTAVRLHPLDADARTAEVRALDELVRVLARLVAAPGPPVSWLLPLGRRLEARDPRAVTRTLLGDLA